jgi:hypothetical protein
VFFKAVVLAFMPIFEERTVAGAARASDCIDTSERAGKQFDFGRVIALDDSFAQLLLAVSHGDTPLRARRQSVPISPILYRARREGACERAPF